MNNYHFEPSNNFVVQTNTRSALLSQAITSERIKQNPNIYFRNEHIHTDDWQKRKNSYNVISFTIRKTKCSRKVYGNVFAYRPLKSLLNQTHI